MCRCVWWGQTSEYIFRPLMEFIISVIISIVMLMCFCPLMFIVSHCPLLNVGMNFLEHPGRCMELFRTFLKACYIGVRVCLVFGKPWHLNECWKTAWMDARHINKFVPTLLLFFLSVLTRSLNFVLHDTEGYSFCNFESRLIARLGWKR